MNGRQHTINQTKRAANSLCKKTKREKTSNHVKFNNMNIVQ